MVPVEAVRRDASFGRPHLVILGAGASLQAFPAGDALGRRLPLMNNVVEVLDLAPVLNQSPVPWKNRDFEKVYSELVQRDDCGDLVRSLEDSLHGYFASLQLPTTPTLYDHLLLSLRPKDGVATFNWDPFLFEAATRVSRIVKLPHIIFLHGNVAIGYCAEDKQKGSAGRECPRCHGPFIPSRLLFPVAKKDYGSDISIRREWSEVRNGLKRAFVVTVFGYGAPRADAVAMRMFHQAWGRAASRHLEELEFIDVATRDALRDRWYKFIHTHHFRVHTDFYDSLLGQHPRRSCEAVWSQTQEIKLFTPDPIPRAAGFAELGEWVEQYAACETDA